jgi:transcriptional regulator with XRE-family HTH domain
MTPKEPGLRGTATRKGMLEIGRRIARIRRERGITQQEMARRLGVSQPVWSSYERGEFRLHAELLRDIARILDACVDEMIGLRVPKRVTGPGDPRFLSRLRKLSRLPRKDKEALLRTIDAFLASARA